MGNDVLPHIFEPFFTTKPLGQGAGLGLAQVHGIVAQHNGHIAVSSTVGAGTTFQILLPALGVEPGRAGSTGAGAAETLPHGAGEVVLLVEDDAALRASLRELLGEWGYCVVEAADGEAALACLMAGDLAIDAVLSDVVMPRLGGVALLSSLREVRHTVPVILMSGYAAADAQAAAAELGVFAWLAKPPDCVQLAHALAAAVRPQQ
jgi:CheY-like chemotaxis protein